MRTWYAESHPLVSFADGSEECAVLLSQLLISGAGANVRSDLWRREELCQYCTCSLTQLLHFVTYLTAGAPPSPGFLDQLLLHPPS